MTNSGSVKEAPQTATPSSGKNPPSPYNPVLTVPRNHGQFYLYKRSPDSSEKLEMTFRSLGRQYDWDLEKYRLSNKPIDTGNQRRLMKNVARLAKNPLGYTYWKLHSKISRTSIFVGLCYLNIVGFAYHFLYLHRKSPASAPQGRSLTL